MLRVDTLLQLVIVFELCGWCGSTSARTFDTKQALAQSRDIQDRLAKQVETSTYKKDTVQVRWNNLPRRSLAGGYERDDQ